MDGWVSPTKSLSAATAQGSREDFRSPGVRSGNIGTDGDALQGGKNRRRGKNENDREKRELTFKEDGQGSLLARSPPWVANITTTMNMGLGLGIADAQLWNRICASHQDAGERSPRSSMFRR